MGQDIAVLGLAVMGENLALNCAEKGFSVAVWNRSPEKTEKFIEKRCKGKCLVGFGELSELVAGLDKPRKVFLLVRAGEAVDAVLSRLLELLEPGDVVADGGNSRWEDTARRLALAEARGIHYLGCGVSGGEEGALRGPALMPGGSKEGWKLMAPILTRIAARAPDGEPCCAYVGPGGSGHFVKMVHNGIEYGDMQLICEAYQLMRDLAGLSNEEMSACFRRWNEGELESYLIQITAEILAYRENGEAVVDAVLDKAGQKGTGKWTVRAALDAGVDLSLIAEAVFARCVSADTASRDEAAGLFSAVKNAPFTDDRSAFLAELEQALYAAKLISYAQGFSLLRAADREQGWGLDLGSVAALWRGGCIIRSRFLEDIRAAFAAEPKPENLLFAPVFRDAVLRCEGALRRVVAEAASCGVPVPALSAALAYFDSLRCDRLPANLLQAQRDYFGAHGYERRDRPGEGPFHTDWTGLGGVSASESYTV